MLAAMLLVSCGEKKQEPIVTPWGEVLDSVEVTEGFDLHEIQQGGELILATISGPQTYYDYHGKSLGTQYLLVQKLADKLGVKVRVEVCRDSLELVKQLADNEVDIVAWPTPGHLEAKASKPVLAEELKAWFKPEMVAEVQKEETRQLTVQRVKRRVFAPMLDKNGGIISHYDHYFQQYSQTIRWDWRLMAAQCYQESTFDPKAVSFAGAKGLMQIMPATADLLGLPRDKMYDPEQNIAAAAKYLGELDRTFADIPDRSERTKFVLAAYNGGHFHIRDAMALARKNGKNALHWREVEPYVLGLSKAEYYNDPVVKHGYMRGSETVDYVRKIHERWNGYRGVKTVRSTTAVSGTPQKAKRERKQKYQIQADN
jgi:membrane-bound lytic murein transglycosylase F